MKILVAGAAGAIGAQLLPRLVAAGHRVAGITRSPQRVAAIRAAGAEAVVCDVFDQPRLAWTVAEARPDAVIHQLTDLPQSFDARRLSEHYEANNRVRRLGTQNLLAAAKAAGARRFLVQSLASWYAPGGPQFRTETDPLWLDAPEPIGGGVRAAKEMEDAVLSSGLEAAVLRYGSFYGPGTWYAAGGSIAQRVRARAYPIVGPGSGVFSFIHVEDAATATVLAVERGATGVYNVVDNYPAPLREWLPAYADALQAGPPRRVPLFVARFAIPRALVEWQHRMPGVSNAKIRTELGWGPRYWSWREGFRSGLG